MSGSPARKLRRQGLAVAPGEFPKLRQGRAVMLDGQVLPVNNEKVCIGYLHPDFVEGYFHDCMVRALFADRAERDVIANVISHACGPRIATGRNDLVRAFLKTKIPWLLMMDDDMVWHLRDVYTLMDSAKAVGTRIAGGLCFAGGRSGTVKPTMYVMLDSSDGTSARMESWPENAMVRVDATGAAFVLIHRDVLRSMEGRFAERTPSHPWFAEGVHNGVEYGEDWFFCLRAKGLGETVYVHTGVVVGHVKPHILDMDDYEQYRKDRAEYGDEGVQARHIQRMRADAR